MLNWLLLVLLMVVWLSDCCCCCCLDSCLSFVIVVLFTRALKRQIQHRAAHPKSLIKTPNLRSSSSPAAGSLQLSIHLLTSINICSRVLTRYWYGSGRSRDEPARTACHLAAHLESHPNRRLKSQQHLSLALFTSYQRLLVYPTHSHSHNHSHHHHHHHPVAPIRQPHWIQWQTKKPVNEPILCPMKWATLRVARVWLDSSNNNL